MLLRWLLSVWQADLIWRLTWSQSGAVAALPAVCETVAGLLSTWAAYACCALRGFKFREKGTELTNSMSRSQTDLRKAKATDATNANAE